MNSHRPVEDIDPHTGRRECRICGRLVVGFGPEMRHTGETVQVVVPAKQDAAAFHAAVRHGADALALVSERATDTEKAMVVVAAVYEAGLLRRKPGKAPRVDASR